MISFFLQFLKFGFPLCNTILLSIWAPQACKFNLIVSISMPKQKIFMPNHVITVRKDQACKKLCLSISFSFSILLSCKAAWAFSRSSTARSLVLRDILWQNTFFFQDVMDSLKLHKLFITLIITVFQNLQLQLLEFVTDQAPAYFFLAVEVFPPERTKTKVGNIW